MTTYRLRRDHGTGSSQPTPEEIAQAKARVLAVVRALARVAVERDFERTSILAKPDLTIEGSVVTSLRAGK